MKNQVLLEKNYSVLSWSTWVFNDIKTVSVPMFKLVGKNKNAIFCNIMGKNMKLTNLITSRVYKLTAKNPVWYVLSSLCLKLSKLIAWLHFHPSSFVFSQKFCYFSIFSFYILTFLLLYYCCVRQNWQLILLQTLR